MGLGIDSARGIGRRLLIAALTGSTSVGAAMIAMQDSARAQVSRQTTFDIQAGPLSNALAAFGRQSGVQVAYLPETASGKRTAGVSGAIPPSEALAQLLAGTGLSYHFTAANTVTITDGAAAAFGAPVDADGATVLGTIDVTGAQGGVGWDGSAETVYSTPGMVSHVSSETIERYRGTSPADVLKGVPGVMSGASRTNGGIDVNIHGLQGMGRVAVAVDGAINAIPTAQGYQGVANRSYIDPDFIGGVAVQKGPSMGATGAGAIGGTVSMRTINADDIIPEGQDSAIRIRMEAGTNTSSPQPVGTRIITRGLLDYLWTADRGGTPSPPTRETDRPGLLLPTSGSGSVVYASRSENFDLVLGAARRMSGNYHVGENGGGAPRKAGEICDGATGTILTYCNRGGIPYTLGLTSYLPGEEVLNTSQDIFSTLAKATFRYEDHTLELIQTHYDSIYGETNPLGFVSSGGLTAQDARSLIMLDTYASRYRWNPDNDLFDLRLNASFTHMDEVSRGAKWSEMTSVDLSNTSRFDTALGDAALTYGASYLYEETAPGNRLTGGGLQRDGERSETSVFADGRWNPTDWLQLNGGLRYHRFSAEDKNPRPELVYIGSGKGDAWDYSLGVAVTPVDGVQLFANYKNAARMPSLFESISTTFIAIDPDLGPERASNWEIGANLTANGLLAADDSLKVKLAYFDNTVDNYIYRRLRQEPYPGLPGYFLTTLDITNLERAKFSGIEFSGQYDVGSFSAQLAATYYTNIEFCRTTATCMNSSVGGDYATNHIPPRFSASLTLSQKLLEDRLTLSGRATYYGGRAAGAEPTVSGANPLIAAVPWRPVLLLDAYAEYQLNDSAKLSLGIENITDQYYVDPLSLALVPSPGRTIRAGLTATLGSSSGLFGGLGDALAPGARDWSGFYVGGHLGSASANSRIADHWSARIRYLPGRDPTVLAPSGPGDFEGDGGSGLIGGIRVGYNHQSGSLLLGAELEGNWGEIETVSAASRAGYEPSTTSYDAVGSASLKAGIAFGDMLAYGKAGLGIASYKNTLVEYEQSLDRSGLAFGLSAGAGLEYAITDNLSLFGEYQHMRLKGSKLTGFVDRRVDGSGDTLDLSWRNKASFDLFKLGVNVRF